jgi:hypothetical protein
MTEEIIQRMMQVFFLTAGSVSFWLITKHMPKAFYNFLEFVTMTLTSLALVSPVAMLIEYILKGNVDVSVLFMGCCASVSFLSTLWMVMVQSSRALQGKKQHDYAIL